MKSSSLDAKSGLYSGTQPKNKTKEKTKKTKTKLAIITMRIWAKNQAMCKQK